jgi:hypothetical protein
MIQRRRRARLSLEALAELSGGELDRHIAAETAIAGLIDNAHTTSADFGDDLVRTNPRTGAHASPVSRRHQPA